ADRTINDEVHAVLLGDIVEDVADVRVDDVEVDRLADESGLAVLLALRRLLLALRAADADVRARSRRWLHLRTLLLLGCAIPKSRTLGQRRNHRRIVGR